MAQILYTLVAIMLLGVTVLNINVKIHDTQDDMMFSELTLQMTSVGAELLNEIGMKEFDPGTISEYAVPRESLSPEASFGNAPCDPDNNFADCDTVSDFHGKTATRTLTRVHNGVTYAVTYNVSNITVIYVSEASPYTPSADPTFAKEVTLTVSTPTLVDGNGNPIEMTMARVYTYPRF